jgi:superfamily II DNA/RNA helicase
MVVLDEVDRMLDMGFVHDITKILGHAKSDRQSFYFTATLDFRVKKIIESFSRDPVYISVKSGDTSDSVEQNVINFSDSGHKIDKLHDILTQQTTTKTIVFDDTHRSVEKLSKELIARGFQADSIHGGKSQSQRQRVLKKFKDSEVTVLVATDVAARGLDVPDISHVINYSLPQSYDDYVHRIGRTGRAGKVGHALTFVEQ